MNLLVVYPYIPFPLDRGTYQRTYHLLKGLAEHHTVDLIALSENGERLENLPVFEEFCREVKFVPFAHPKWPKLFSGRLFSSLPTTIAHWKTDAVSEAIDEQLSKYTYDGVHVCDIVMAQYFLKNHKDIPLTIDRSRVDLQYQTQQAKFGLKGVKSRLLAIENMAKLRFYEKNVARRSRMQFLCGPDDEIFVRKHISKSVPLKVIPNGVNLEYFDAAFPGDKDPEPTIMFCGAMDYLPNIDALRWYFSSIHDQVIKQIPNLKVYIVGRDAGDEINAYGEKQGVTVTGGVEDVRPYYKRAWLQMVPLRIGGGTRLKIVESLSIGTPVVSTSIGAQGLGLTDDVDIMLADEPATFADKLVSTLNSSIKREKLSCLGQKKAISDFSWSQIGRDFAGAFNKGASPLRDRTRLLEIAFDRVTMNGALTRIAEMVEKGKPCQIATANVDFIVQSRKDPELREILDEAEMVLCDGTPLVWLSRLLKNPLPQRVAGSDMTPHLLTLAERKGWRVYFLGGKQDVLEKAVANVKKYRPGIEIAGCYSPAFAPLEDMDHEDIINRVREAKPHLLLTHFGCPKQEKWLSRHLESTGVPVGIGLGATVDFLAGDMKRAPKWMRIAGCEWVFRLLQEPKRLANRYFKDLIVFGASAYRELNKQSGTTV